MNGRQKYPAASPPFEQLAQMIPAFHADDCFIADKSFGINELPRELVVQIRAVGNQHDGGAGEIDALHKQAGQKQHGKALPSSGSAEISSALAITLGPPMNLDIVV